MLKRILFILACAVCTSSMLPHAYAQPVPAQATDPGTASKKSDIQVEANVDRAIVELGETFEYTVKVSTMGSSEIRLVEEPDVRPFSVMGRSHMPQYIIRNGVSERSLTIIYRLRTRRVGDKIVINPPVLAVGAERVSPAPITIKVVKKGEGPKEPQGSVRNDAVYVETTVSLDRAPYVGEQIVLQYDLFIDSRKIEAQPSPPSEPSLDAFWIEELNDRTMGSRQLIRQGSKFFEKILLRRYSIYPLQAGEALIDAMTVPLTTGGFMRSRENIEVASKPILLDVQPLPSGAPDDFYDGNVGDWDFLVTSDSLRTRVGRAVTIRISARGNGQAGRVQLPEVKDLPGAVVGESEQDTKQSIVGGQIIGEKFVRYAVTPLEEGVLEIPALSFSYFDPEAGEYRTKQSAPIKVEVGEGELPPEPEHRETPVSRTESSQNDVMSALRSELAGVHTRIDLSEETSALEGGFERSTPYRVALALSLLLMCGVLFAPLWRRLRPGDSPERQRERIYRQALSMLEEDCSYEEVASAIKLYCVDVLGLSRGHVTERELPRHLEGLGASATLAHDLADVLGTSDKARYASNADVQDATTLAVRARKLITKLHKSLSRRGAGERVAGALVLWTATSLVLVMGMWPAHGHADEIPSGAEVTIDSALKAHEAHQWESAVAQWSTLARRSPHNADVHYALGTAALHHEDLGLAVLSLERALLYRPKDRDVARNLAIAERMVRVKTIESLRGRSQVIAGSDDFFWWDMARKVSGSTLAILLMIAIWGVIIAALARPRMKEDVARDLVGLAGLIALLVMGITASTWIFREHIMSTTHPVVVLEDRPMFRDGPSEHAAERSLNSPVVAGARFVMDEERKGWLKLRLPDGSSGWIVASSVGRVVQR